MKNLNELYKLLALDNLPNSATLIAIEECEYTVKVKKKKRGIKVYSKDETGERYMTIPIGHQSLKKFRGRI